MIHKSVKQYFAGKSALGLVDQSYLSIFKRHFPIFPPSWPRRYENGVDDCSFLAVCAHLSRLLATDVGMALLSWLLPSSWDRMQSGHNCGLENVKWFVDWRYSGPNNTQNSTRIFEEDKVCFIVFLFLFFF